jgi:hypothetical protein
LSRCAYLLFSSNFFGAISWSFIDFVLFSVLLLLYKLSINLNRLRVPTESYLPTHSDYIYGVALVQNYSYTNLLGIHDLRLGKKISHTAHFHFFFKVAFSTSYIYRTTCFWHSFKKIIDRRKLILCQIFDKIHKFLCCVVSGV